MIVTGSVLLLFGACDAEFSVARDRLDPWRVVGLGVLDGIASIALWSGIGPWHEEPTQLSWSLDGELLGEGYGVEVPGPGELSVEAIAPDGQSASGSVTVAEGLAITGWAREAVTLEELELEDRREASGTEVAAAVAADEATRVTLTVDGDVETRWMSTRGTPLALDARRADLLNEDVVFDDGELEERSALEAGLTHHLALVLDGAGANSWSWIDSAHGVEGDFWRHEGRLLPGLADAGLVAGTLVADDEHGVVLDELEPVADLAEQEPLDCAPADEPFRLAWVVEGRCLRPDVVGARVVVEAW